MKNSTWWQNCWFDKTMEFLSQVSAKAASWNTPDFVRQPVDCEIGLLHFTQRPYLLYTHHEKSSLCRKWCPSYDLRFVKRFKSPNLKHTQITEGFRKMPFGRSVQSFEVSTSHQAALYRTQNKDDDFTSIENRVRSASLKAKFFHVSSSLNMTYWRREIDC
jgi:hypothetical protein